MKKNRLLWVVIPAAAAIIAVIVVAVVLISGQQKREKYYAQLQSARQYLTTGDYDEVVEAFETAISLRPTEAETYIELAAYQEAEGEYEAALATAQIGYEMTSDEYLSFMIEELTEQLVLLTQQENTDTESNDMEETEEAGETGDSDSEQEEELIVSGTDNEDLALRYSVIDDLADFCYYELLEEYGDVVTTTLNDDGSYQLKLKGFSGYIYFQNTSEYPDLVDKVTRVPADNAKPWKYEISTCSQIFIRYEGYISFQRLVELFGDTDAETVYDEDLGTYMTSLHRSGCTIRIETDSAGNVYLQTPVIELYPDELLKEDWEPETEPETQEDPGTFTLGGQTFTYDVESIYIYGETITDLSPLENCENLRELFLIDCTLGSLDPLSGCESLVYLYLRESVGFSDLSALAGLSNLQELNLHGCSDVADISPIMDMELVLLHTCDTQVTYEQTYEYLVKHPNCEVWYDSHVISLESADE